jgi:hypothetical protein
MIWLTSWIPGRLSSKFVFGTAGGIVLVNVSSGAYGDASTRELGLIPEAFDP